MKNKTVIITGATSGIGLETARELAQLNYTLVLGCRNKQKALLIKEELIRESGNEFIEVIHLDLASFKSIYSFVEEFKRKYNKLDILFNNAGLFCDSAKKTVEGFEMTMGVNYIGNYLITNLLLDSLRDAVNARIIFISSKAAYYGSIKLKDNFFENHAHGFKAYSASKLALTLYTIYLSRKLKNDNITVNAVHPGQVATNIWKGESLLMKIMGPINKKKYDSPVLAAKTGIYLVISDDVKEITGKMFENKDQIMTYNKKILNENLMTELINYTENIINFYTADK